MFPTLSPTLTFVIDVQSLDSSNAANPLASFDPTKNHTWIDVITTTGRIHGTFDPADFTFDTSEFQNALAHRPFQPTRAGLPSILKTSISTFSAAPEPSTCRRC